MAKLQSEGKVKYLGISEATSDEIRRAHKIAKISAYQIEVRSRLCTVHRLHYTVSSLLGHLTFVPTGFWIPVVSLEYPSSRTVHWVVGC